MNWCDNVTKKLEEKKKEFNLVVYSAKKDQFILLRPIQCVLQRKNKPDHYYFDYADENLYGKYISNSKCERDGYEFICAL